jgi:cell division protein FtsW
MSGKFFKHKKKKNGKNWHEPDKSLITAMMAVIVVGLVFLFSASSVISYFRFGYTHFYFKNQFIALIIGLVVFFVVSRIDYRIWKKYAFFFLLVSISLLTLVFVPGLRSEYGTAYSWINIFGYSFQPSELVKLSFLIYLATWLEAKKNKLGNWKESTFPFLVVLGLISVLMLAQPDLGTLFIIAFSAIIVFFVGGGKLKHIFIVMLLVGLGSFLFFSFNSSYQSDRFECFKNPSYGIQDKCYQINQSLIAVGSGGWFGRGLGESRQKFMYLPEVWGDSIFPIITEEIGFIFSTLLILLYLFIFYRGLIIAKNAPDLYGSALATGIISWLAIQTFLNIGGMINLIPMTGVPLPFISAGGSAILSALIGMGILVNISKQT